MIVRILTDRREGYAAAEDLYCGIAEFRYSSGKETEAAGDYPEDDIIVADPGLPGLDRYAGSLMKRRTISGKPFIICDPGRVKSLIRELKAAGLEIGDPQEQQRSRADRPQNTTEDFLPEHESLRKQKPVFRQTVGIVELQEGCGADFLTLLLAEELASEASRDGSLVTVIAPDCDYFYYAMALGKRFQGKSFRSLTDLKVDQTVLTDGNREIFNLDEGICWAVSSGQDQEKSRQNSGTGREWMDLLEGNYLLCYYSARSFDEENVRMPEKLDAVIAVTDPLPSSLMAGRFRLEILRNMDLPVIYTVNHTCSSLKKDLLLDYLDTESVVFLPAADPDAVCEAEYAGENPYRYDVIRKTVMSSVCSLTEWMKRLKEK